MTSNEGIETQTAWLRLWRYGPLMLWMAFISFASTSEFSAINTSRIIAPLLVWLFPGISSERLNLIHFFIRKTAHFSEYAVLGLLTARAFVTSTHTFLRHYWFQTGVLLIASYALLDEYHQSFVPSRTASIYDSLIDMAGGLAALAACAIWRRRLTTKTPLAANQN
jgi:VanZ family protein